MEYMDRLPGQNVAHVERWPLVEVQLYLNLPLPQWGISGPIELKSETNILVTVLFTGLCSLINFSKVLYSLAAAYWRGDDTGERSMCLTFGLFFFVVAMAVLVIDESLLDFGLDKGK